MKTGDDTTRPRRPRWAKVYRHPQLADSLAVNGLPSIATGLPTYDAVLSDLLAKRTPRKSKR